ncbi:MAG: bifunctional glycosyltransferase family 2/GtrA family protein [Clostridia bacterium]|nr:bifunctional glycosyltransferase family 2/GtrA family protein [Clostridia bacterium]
MNIFDKITVIVPSLNPDEKLMKVIEGLEKEGFYDIIVVNDGSRAENLANFPDPKEHPICTVLTHSVNRGKGAALKTAFDFFLKNRPDRLGVVTVDGDNQHLPGDVKSCSQKMLSTSSLVLGVRDFSLSHVPARSRFGNKTTSLVFRILCGMKISDTQTGLRAFPREILPWMCEIEGDRFEYETNMLLSLGEYGIKLSEQTIETVYIEENQTSHFRPIRDSIRVYSMLLKFLLSSVAASVIDNFVFWLMLTFFGGVLGKLATLVSFVCARSISSVINFAVNKQKVFKNSKSVKETILKYYALAIPIMAISIGAVELLDRILANSVPIITTLIKIAVDLVLFICSFRIQREWVFSSRKNK